MDAKSHYFPCHCQGRDGKLKNTYPTEQAAREAVEYAEASRGATLRPYRCPHGAGWHLTSKVVSWL